MSTLWSDISVALRQFRRRPSFVLAVLSTLALAIGANIAVFSVVQAVLFRALPFTHPEQLVWIASVRSDNPSAPFTLPEFIDYRPQTRTLTGLAAFANWSGRLSVDETTEALQGARISGNGFDVLGVRPVVGRLLRDSDDDPRAKKVVVLSHRLWQRRFRGDPGIAGTTVRLNGESFQVAGVLPAHMPFAIQDVDVFVPLAPDQDPRRYTRASTNFLRFFGRLVPGVSAEQTQAELATICLSLKEQFPREYARKQAVRVVDLRETLIGDFRESMLVLLGAVLLVLGTGLANLVSLVLVRANERRTELSIRIAIGASRWRILRQLLVESLLLAVAGCGLGWMLAMLLISAVLPHVPASIPRIAEVAIDGSVLGFAVLIASAAALILTVAPLRAVLRADAGDALRSASRGAVGDRWSGRLRRVLVSAEISAALLLLLSTTALLQNVRQLGETRLGFTPAPVFQARISIPETYKSPDDVARFYDRLSSALASAPGVEAVGLINVAPLSGLLLTVPFTVDGESRHERDQPNVNLRVVSPGYFAAIGSRLIDGRLLAEADRSESPRVALVSSALAKRFLHDAPVGRRLFLNDNNTGPRPVQIVGVIEDVRQVALDGPPSLDVYIPLRQVHPDGMVFLRNNQFWMVRTATAPAAFRLTFQAHLRAIDKDAAVNTSGSMRDYIDAGLGPRRFNLGLFGAFSLTGVLLCVVGMYGLVSFAVSQRTAEIGLRMAIGATEADIQRMILREAVTLGISGTTVGGVLAIVVSRFAANITVAIPAAGAITSLLLALVTLAALVPARRAARIHPTVALKGDV
jgi:putative ABC transport system permease protein